MNKLFGAKKKREEKGKEMGEEEGKEGMGEGEGTEGEGEKPVDKGLERPFHPLVINQSLICQQHVIISAWMQ